jgi:hypothetical protein
MSRIEEMLKVAREIARTELEPAGLNGRLRALVGETPATPGERLTLTPPGNGSNGHGGNGAAGKIERRNSWRLYPAARRGRA